MSESTQIKAENFLPVYVPAAKAGKSAKEIAALVYNVEIGAVTKKMINNVTQTSGRLRRDLVDQGGDPTRIPQLKRGNNAGRSKGTKWLDVLDELSPVKDNKEGETAETGENKAEGEANTEVAS